MAQIILSINAGSSSVKISVYKTNGKDEDPAQLAETQVAGLTAPPSTFSYSRGNEKIKNKQLDQPVKTQDEAFKFLLSRLVNDTGLSEISEAEDITVACHRIVHGGDFDDAQLITGATMHRLEALTDLAPLHNAPALAIVRSCITTLPTTKNIAYFDSAFHATLPPHIRTYAINQTSARKNGLRKYGFHGISYAFISRAVAAHLHKPASELNIIALHLGSGASACAIQHGQSLDTSMGLTPLAGLPGATRSGDIDPSLVFHLSSSASRLSPRSTSDMHISTAEDLLNSHSGWKALAGTTDFSHIATSASEESKLAFALFVDRILGFIGSYYLKLSGEVDALVFAGGIGEKSAELRRAVAERTRCIGFAVDEGRNQEAAAQRRVVVDIGDAGGRRTLVVRTDEQLEMARGCVVHPEIGGRSDDEGCAGARFATVGGGI